MVISQDERRVRVQAGTYNYEVVSALWEQGYVTGTDLEALSTFGYAL